MKVIKRDGRITNFDEKKIFDAINAANKTLEKEKRITEQQIMDVVSWIMKKIPKAKEEISVEEIQDLVEDGLVHKNHTEVVRNYIKYRDERQKERFKKLEILKEIKEKLDASNVQNQNANVDEASFGGRKMQEVHIIAATPKSSSILFLLECCFFINYNPIFT